jgi:ribosomal protein L3
MGVRKVTAMNLKVVFVDTEKNLIGLHGAVAGGKGAVVSIREARKA